MKESETEPKVQKPGTKAALGIGRPGSSGGDPQGAHRATGRGPNTLQWLTWRLKPVVTEAGCGGSDGTPLAVSLGVDDSPVMAQLTEEAGTAPAR